MALINFDASQVQPSEAMEAIPAGWYNAAIDESDVKPTKDGNGSYLHLRFTIMDGQYANRKVFTRLNIRNANPVAQEIAYKQLSAICHAVGVMQVADTGQLHGQPMKIKVKVRAATGEYEASNEISGFKNINEQVDNTMAPAGQAPWAAQTAQPPAMPPAQQPWQGQPQQMQQPMQQAPLQQPMQQPPQQAAQPPQQAAQPWQQPAAQQPWAAAPQQAVQQQQAPVQQQQQQAPVQQQPQQAPVQQQQQQAPVQQQPQVQQQAAQHPAQAATPPWMQQVQQPVAGSAPPWQQPT